MATDGAGYLCLRRASLSIDTFLFLFLPRIYLFLINLVFNCLFTALMELLSDIITFEQDGRFDNSMCRLYTFNCFQFVRYILDSLFYDLTYAAYVVDWHKRNTRECHHVCNANTCINNNNKYPSCQHCHFFSLFALRVPCIYLY